MKALVDFISEYQPIYQTIVQGYSEEQIEDLEDTLGRPLPGAYREFLSTIAANVGFDTADANFRLDAVFRVLYARGRTIPERFVPIAEDEGTTFCDYYLDLSHPVGEGDALVVRIAAGAEINAHQIPAFWSLRDLLFSWAFLSVRMPVLPEQTMLRWVVDDAVGPKPSPALMDLQGTMLRLGFKALSVTSAAAQIYERGDCAAYVYQAPFVESFSLRIAAQGRAAMIHVAEVVRDALPTHSH